jgi:hypothetical protein
MISSSSFKTLLLLTMVLLDAATQSTDARPLKSKKSNHDFMGYYMGIDPVDGSFQQMQIVMNDEGTFDILMADSSFRNCADTNQGLAKADGIEIPSSSFDFPLYCTKEKGGTVDFDAEPDAMLVGGFEVLGGGDALRRPNGYTYFKQ